jgi:hypothetical protein
MELEAGQPEVGKGRVDDVPGEMFTGLFEAFAGDQRAVVDLYKLWILGDLQTREHQDRIKEAVEKRKEDEIIEAVLAQCPDKVKEYFQGLRDQQDTLYNAAMEALFHCFDLLKFKGACFEESETI